MIVAQCTFPRLRLQSEGRTWQATALSRYLGLKPVIPEGLTFLFQTGFLFYSLPPSHEQLGQFGCSERLVVALPAPEHLEETLTEVLGIQR